MEFCDDCGSMMKKESIDGEALWVCPNGHRQPVEGSGGAYVVTEEQEAGEVIESTGGTDTLPETDETCPNCGHDRAYWYIQQIRAADESETRFYICTECEHKWREDDN
ncbi:MAG: RPA12/RPB9/RPC11 RNA polymerase family protein [Halobacteriaceae archaeon]